MTQYLALITILGDGGGGRPDNTLPPAGGGGGGQPPGYWGGIAPPWVDNTLPGWQPRPSHPIAPGGRPPGPSQGPGFPTNPIAPGGPPPGYWGGIAPPYPDQGLPPAGGGGGGYPSHPIYNPPYPDQGLPGQPPRPTHPIVIPPDGLAPGIPSQPIYWPIAPDQGLPGEQPKPEHPIVIPGDDERNPKFEVKTAWTAQTGWVVAIVPTEEATVPTPSK